MAVLVMMILVVVMVMLVMMMMMVMVMTLVMMNLVHGNDNGTLGHLESTKDGFLVEDSSGADSYRTQSKTIFILYLSIFIYLYFPTSTAEP